MTKFEGKNVDETEPGRNIRYTNSHACILIPTDRGAHSHDDLDHDGWGFGTVLEAQEGAQWGVKYRSLSDFTNDIHLANWPTIDKLITRMVENQGHPLFKPRSQSRPNPNHTWPWHTYALTLFLFLSNSIFYIMRTLLKWLDAYHTFGRQSYLPYFDLGPHHITFLSSNTLMAFPMRYIIKPILQEIIPVLLLSIMFWNRKQSDWLPATYPPCNQ